MLQQNYFFLKCLIRLFLLLYPLSCFIFFQPCTYPKTNQYTQPSGKNTAGSHSYKHTEQTYATYQNNSNTSHSLRTAQQSYNFNSSDTLTRPQLSQNSTFVHTVAYQQPGRNAAADEDSLAPSVELEQAARKMSEAQISQQKPTLASTQRNIPSGATSTDSIPKTMPLPTNDAANVTATKPAQENKWIPAEQRFKTEISAGMAVDELKQKIQEHNSLPWYKKLSFIGPQYSGTITIDGKAYKWEVQDKLTTVEGNLSGPYLVPDGKRLVIYPKGSNMYSREAKYMNINLDDLP